MYDNDLDKLAYHVDRMQSLLSDRHPGLFTWVEALCEHWQVIADMAGGQDRSWTKDWPTEPGYYWFYGWCFRERHRSPETHLVEVWRTATPGVVSYVTEGHFLYKEEGADGYWMPARVPEPPAQMKGGEEQNV